MKKWYNCNFRTHDPSASRPPPPHCIAVLCCGYTLTDYPTSIRLTSLALWQSNDCPSASKAALMNMDKYFMWIHYERLHNHIKAKHNKTLCKFLGIYCIRTRQYKDQLSTVTVSICNHLSRLSRAAGTRGRRWGSYWSWSLRVWSRCFWGSPTSWTRNNFIYYFSNIVLILYNS